MCELLAYKLKNVSLHAVLGMGKCMNSAQTLTFKDKSERKICNITMITLIMRNSVTSGVRGAVHLTKSHLNLY